MKRPVPASGERAGLALLLDRGAAELAHPGGTLGAHLGRVADRLEAHGAGPVAVAAGAAHAAYGTDGFPHPLLGLDERDLLRAAVGPAAEAAVRQYGGCDRGVTYPQLGAAVVPFRDRFSGVTTPVNRAELTTFAAITVANELDVADHADLTAGERAGLGRLLWSLADLVTPEATADLARTLGPP